MLKAEAEVNSYYDRETGVGVSASCFIYSIASQLVKTNNELLWYALFVCSWIFRACIVGACSLFQIQTISLDRYINDVNLLEKEVLRLNSNTLLGNCDIYLEENSLNLSLFKHWTLFKSLMYSIHSASKFQTLSEKGKRRIEIFLAKIGYPMHFSDNVGFPFPKQTSLTSFWSPPYEEESPHKLKRALQKRAL